MKIKLSKSQWEFIGKKAGWAVMEESIALFNNLKCEVNKMHYSNGRTALQLTAAEDGDNFSQGKLIATATVNMPDEDLEPDEVIIKDHNENEGMLMALVKAKIVEPTGRSVKSGFVFMPICKLLI